MNIGIIKLWFSLSGKNSELSQSTGWSEETWDFAKTCKKLEHNTFIISNVDGESYLPEWNKEKLDVIFVFNSKNKIEQDDSIEKIAKYDKDVIAYKNFCTELKKYSHTKIVYVVTDLELIDYDFVVLSNQIISQGDVGKYLPIEQLPLNKNFLKININAENKIIYLGNERDDNRTKKLLEYYKKFDGQIDIYGKWKNKNITGLKNFMGPIDFKETQRLLNKYRYSLMITDKKYEEQNFVTPRYYEAITAGCLPIIDVDYDKKNRLLSNFTAAKKEVLMLTRDKWFELIHQTTIDCVHYYSFVDELKKFLEELK
jgi:hypothetical protein